MEALSGKLAQKDFKLKAKTEKTISLICAQRKNFFELKKDFLIQKKFFNSKK